MNLESVAGKVVFISGASRGVGAGMAERYSKLGMKLVLCSRSAPILPESEDVLSRAIDVRDEAGIEKLVLEAESRFGSIDLWINNAGVLEPVRPVRDISVDEFREHIEVNLMGVFIGTRAYLQHRRRVSGHPPSAGVLINVSSGAAWNPYQGWGAYCAGKAAVERLTEVVALEEEGTGLRVHSIAPGVVDTPMQEVVCSSSAAHFPEVERFRERKERGELNSVRFVADEFLAIAFDPARETDSVEMRLEDEKK